MTKSEEDGGPKLGTLKYLVSSVLASSDHGTVALITAKEAGGGRYALRVLKREDEADDLAIERARAEHAVAIGVRGKQDLLDEECGCLPNDLNRPVRHGGSICCGGCISGGDAQQQRHPLR